MNVINLFDGISCGQLALQRAGIPVEKYYASEIDKNAIKITMDNFPNTIQLGDVRMLSCSHLSGDVLAEGSSLMGNPSALKGIPSTEDLSASVLPNSEAKSIVSPGDLSAVLRDSKTGSVVAPGDLSVVLRGSKTESIVAPGDLSAVLRDSKTGSVVAPGDLSASVLLDSQAGQFLSSPFTVFMSGNPCTNLSLSGKRNGFVTKDKIKVLSLEQYLDLKASGWEFDGQSYLFWEAVRLLEEIKPKYFLFENVRMQREWEEVFNRTLGVEPIEINSALVSAQTRKRLYWTNIPGITQPGDRCIKLIDILDDKTFTTPAAIRGRNIDITQLVSSDIPEGSKQFPVVQCLEVHGGDTDKSNCLTTVEKDNVLTCLEPGRHIDAFGKFSGTPLPYRYYTRSEYERLQTLPVGYTRAVSESAAKKAIGNGWTVDIIAHILSHIPKEDWL